MLTCTKSVLLVKCGAVRGHGLDVRLAACGAEREREKEEGAPIDKWYHANGPAVACLGRWLEFFFFFFPSRQQLAANSEVSAEAGTCCELSPTAHTGYTLSFSSFCLSFLVLSTLLVLKKKEVYRWARAHRNWPDALTRDTSILMQMTSDICSQRFNCSELTCVQFLCLFLCFCPHTAVIAVLTLLAIIWDVTAQSVFQSYNHRYGGSIAIT